MRLAGRNPPQPGQGHTPLDVIYDGRRPRVRVAEFVDLTDAHLWRQRQSAAYLLSQLRDGLRAIGDTGLAHDLVAGRLAAAPPDPPKTAGFSPAQRQAYASCMAPGVRLVWGPPGTGKTWVLSEAISDLAAAGKRVLLVSATNVAVDNALLGVLRHRKHRPGELVRVGAPHLRAIAADPDVSLTHLVRNRLAAVEQRRDNLTQQLLALRRRADALTAAEATLAGFDPAEHSRIRTLITTTDQIPHLTAALDQTNRQHQTCQTALARADELITTAETAVTDTADTVHALGRIADLNRDWTVAQAAADQIGITAMTARVEADRLTAELHAAMAGTRLQRWRNRSTITALETSVRTQRDLAEQAERRDLHNRQLLDRVRASIDEQITELRQGVRYTDEQISQRHAALVRARAYRRTIADQKSGLDQRLRVAQDQLTAAEAAPRPTDAERASIERADRGDLPCRHEQLLIMRAEAATAETGRQRLEQQYADVQDEFDRLRRDAETELIKQATVVATTLARMRTSKPCSTAPTTRSSSTRSAPPPCPKSCSPSPAPAPPPSCSATSCNSAP